MLSITQLYITMPHEILQNTVNNDYLEYVWPDWPDHRVKAENLVLTSTSDRQLYQGKNTANKCHKIRLVAIMKSLWKKQSQGGSEGTAYMAVRVTRSWTCTCL